MNIYLAGPIFNCTDSECSDWRASACRLLSWATPLDPMLRDYRGNEASNCEAIVEGDLRDIENADAVLANIARPSWGTAMEIRHAFKVGVPVVAFGAASASVSPWLIYHCYSISETMLYAVSVLHQLRTASRRA